MLPSKGYFRSIDCPFYKSNLCHRFYCHFRHNKKEGLLSSDLEMTNYIECDDNSEVCQADVDETIFVNCKQSLESCQSILDTTDKSSHTNVEAVDKNRAYSLPTDIPKYNPTPISELKTRHKQCFKKADENTKSNDLTEKLINKNKIDKDPALIETLVDYLMEDKTVIVDDKVDKGEEADSRYQNKNNFQDNISHQNISNADSGKENISVVTNTNVKKSVNLNEIIIELNNFDNEPKPEKEILDNATLLEDLMGIDSNITCDNAEEKRVEDLNLQEKKKIEKNSWDYSLKKYKPNLKTLKHRHKKKYINSLFGMGNRQESQRNDSSNDRDVNKHCIHKSVRRFGQTKKLNKRVSKDVESDNVYFNDNCSKEPFSNTMSDPEEVIIISDSDSDDCTVLDNVANNKSGEINTHLENTKLPEPKRKIRISHVTCSSSVQQSDCFLQQKTVVDTNNTDSDYPMSKQKKRRAHELSYRTLSVQSLQDHFSYCEDIKERVKHKCVNPSEEPGFQNWARVKISPVPNVESLVNSKKLLYAKIHQWKSKANV